MKAAELRLQSTDVARSRRASPRPNVARHERLMPDRSGVAPVETCLHSPTVLKLHGFGLQRLHDPNWTGMNLFDELKQHVRGRREPTTLLFKTIENGLLFHLGLWLYREYLQDECFLECLKDEYLAWYLEDYLEFLRFHQVRDRNRVLSRLGTTVTRISRLLRGVGKRDTTNTFNPNVD